MQGVCQAWVPGLWCSVPLAQADEGGHRLCRTFCAGDHQGTGGPVGGGLKRPGRSPGRPSSLGSPRRGCFVRMCLSALPTRGPGRPRTLCPPYGPGAPLDGARLLLHQVVAVWPLSDAAGEAGGLVVARARAFLGGAAIPGARGARASPWPCTVLDVSSSRQRRHAGRWRRWHAAASGGLSLRPPGRACVL